MSSQPQEPFTVEGIGGYMSAGVRLLVDLIDSLDPIDEQDHPREFLAVGNGYRRMAWENLVNGRTGLLALLGDRVAQVNMFTSTITLTNGVRVIIQPTERLDMHAAGRHLSAIWFDAGALCAISDDSPLWSALHVSPAVVITSPDLYTPHPPTAA